MAKKYKSRGLVIILVSHSSPSSIKSLLDKAGGKLPIAWGGGSAYGVRGVPHAYLLDHRNKVIWEGHPGGGRWDSLAIEALKNIPKGLVFDESQFPQSFRSLFKYLKKQKWSSALSRLKKFLHSKKEEEKEGAVKILERIVAYLQTQMEIAKELLQEKDYGEAIKILKKIDKGFCRAFDPKLKKYGKEASKLYKKLKNDKEVKKELRAWKYLEKAKAIESTHRKSNLEKAAQIYLYILKKYSNTKAAKMAQNRVEELRKRRIIR